MPTTPETERSETPAQRAAPSLAVLAAVLGTVLAVALLTHAVTRRLVNEGVYLKNYRRPFFEESMLYHKMTYALSSKEYNDVLILGDSSALMDVEIEGLEKATGLRAYNLGTMGWLHVDGHMDTLRDYLESHPRPRLIVYTVLPKEMGDGCSSNEAFKDRFIWAYGRDLKKERGFERWPLEFRLREEFRTMVGLLVGGQKRYFKNEVVPGLTHDQFGAALEKRRGYFTRDARKLTRYDLEALRVSRAAGVSLRRLAVFTGQNRIRLLIRFGPIPKQKKSTAQREFTEWYDGFQSDFKSHVVVDKPLVLEYDLNLFSDASHLNPAGARKFTALIADRIAHLKLK